MINATGDFVVSFAINRSEERIKMREFDYKDKWKKLLTPEIVSMLTQIHEFKRQQVSFIETKADKLTQLVDIARIQSTEASNKIEGIYTSDDRIRALVKDKTRPKNINEREIAGYRDVLNTIHDSHEHIPPKPSIILQLHRDLYKFEGYDVGGKYKSSDNVIEEEDSLGNKFVRFQPVPAWETPEAVEELCRSFEEASATGKIEQLILIPMFILDFLCIHPFNNGNGRMSRLLTLLLLYRAGYSVGKYISIERQIEATKENMSKPDRVRQIIKETVGTITKAEIIEKCPDISQTTIQRALLDLTENGEIIKIGGGRYTKYTWNNEK